MEAARVLIVEDEVIVSRDIAMSLKKMNCTVAGTTATGEAAVELALELRPDLVLMDIRLKGKMDGIQAAEEIRTMLDVPIVFLTANSDHATVDRARVVEPYGYVLKPFTDADLLTALTMALHRHHHVAAVRKECDHLHQLVAGNGQGPMFVKSSKRLLRLPMEDIHYVESMRDYLGIHLKEKRYIVHSTMKEFETRLPQGDFMRIHRSYIVRLDKVMAIEGQTVILESGVGMLPIGITYFQDISQRVRSI